MLSVALKTVRLVYSCTPYAVTSFKTYTKLGGAKTGHNSIMKNISGRQNPMHIYNQDTDHAI